MKARKGSRPPTRCRSLFRASVLHGGGFKMGQVIGRSTRDGGEPASEPIRIRNLIATIMHYLFDVGQVRLIPGIAGDVSRVITDGEPIAALFE